MQRLATRLDLVSDTVALIIWLIAGVTGGSAAGELLKGNYDLGPGNIVAGAIGGVVGAQILLLLIPALRGFDSRCLTAAVRTVSTAPLAAA